ncbi:MAG: hypothetical protein Unbinned2250contig1000_12 [Prokaryotic dsDNA virus sp.]|nr:MAG: hypothetical protein Unbinned2250contig1000_12 [Prokaryotic dsDNA virus sp.]|tara:strand:+ start:4805 stop:4990 length:186 start_codon:yes stop_codon:yes gene_type:complete
MRKNYTKNMFHTIPKIIKLGTLSDHRTYTKETIRYFGFYEDTGFKGFFRKVLMGIKAKINE